jgi:hypothetical protein
MPVINIFGSDITVGLYFMLDLTMNLFCALFRAVLNKA